MNRAAAFPVAAGLLALDQLTKLTVIRRMPLGSSVDIFPFFSLTHVQNTGVAFGLLSGLNVFFAATTVLILTLLFVMWRRFGSANVPSVLGFGLVSGGAVGNLVDRVRLGAVTDFLDFYLRGWHWPAFNVADSAVCVGAVLLAFWSLPAPSADAAPGRP
ncbi:MAG TPA: signal peptidase II [Elusimicrobiota bacterium]|nr:signal peptidase II [Elusimicrobiota bacterium]